MQPDEKKKLVERLVDLTVPNTMRESDMSTKVGSALASGMRQRMRQEQIDVRMRHLSPEQISALLAFYDSAMGRSILESQAEIERELGSSMSLISHDVHDQVIEELQSEIFPLQADGSLGPKS